MMVVMKQRRILGLKHKVYVTPPVDVVKVGSIQCPSCKVKLFYSSGIFCPYCLKTSSKVMLTIKGGQMDDE